MPIFYFSPSSSYEAYWRTDISWKSISLMSSNDAINIFDNPDAWYQIIDMDDCSAVSSKYVCAVILLLNYPLEKKITIRILLWDPYTTRETDQLGKVQRHAARFISTCKIRETWCVKKSRITNCLLYNRDVIDLHWK